MAAHINTGLDPALYPAGMPIESGSSAVAWPAVWAGSFAAIALSIVLLTLGSGFGLAEMSVWPGAGAKPATFSIAAGIWLIVTQWLASAVGGYLAGRMRIRWHSLHSDEVYFRDTAHGLLTWATATILVSALALLSAALTSVPNDVAVSPEAADAARKVAADFAIFTGLAMVVGAFIASVSAVLGGHLRDRHP